MTLVPPISISEAEWHIVKSILRACLPTSNVYAFGSRVLGTAKPYSDLDLLIVAAQPLSWAESANLAEAFSESDLPWKVDISDWARTTDEFRAMIMKNAVALQIAAPH